MPMAKPDKTTAGAKSISHKASTGGGTAAQGMILEAIETISYGLLQLNSCKDELDRVGGKPLVDIAARLNKQVNELYDITGPLKNRLKNEVLTLNQGSNQPSFLYPGQVYQAKVSRITKVRIVADKVRAILGKNISKVQDRTEEITINFDVRG